MSDKLPALNNLPVPALTDLLYIVTPGIDPLGSFNITLAQIQAFLLSVAPNPLSSNFVLVGTTGAGPDNLMGFSVPGNTLDVQNAYLYASAAGQVSAQNGGAGDTRTIVWSYGGQTIDTRVINAVNTVCNWRVELFIGRILASGAGSTRAISWWSAWNSGVDTAPIRDFQTQPLLNVNHANANNLLFTGASSDAAVDDITQMQLTIIKYPPT